MTLAELAERTGLVKSTILRLALSLQQYRLLARLPDGSYRLDAETLRLGLGSELVAVDLRQGLDDLGRVVGAVVTEDLLDRIFRRFCIGK